MIEQIADGAAIANGDPDRLIVFFSSLRAYAKGTFDSADFSGDFPCMRLYLRDESETWFYHNGIPGLTNNMQENAEFLKYFVSKYDPKRVTFVGMSLGGYASIALGHLVGVDDVHVVSPVNYLNAKIGKHPEASELWQDVFTPVNKYFDDHKLDPKMLDLRSFIDENPNSVKIVRQHVVRTEQVDMNHAAHIGDYDHVETCIHERGRHSTLAALMLRSGELVDSLMAPVDKLISAKTQKVA